jgi:DNA-binding MarR family transcriptional regulator
MTAAAAVGGVGKNLYEVLQFFRKKLDAVDLPVQQIILFLKVAEQEGVTLTELQNLTSMPQGTVSRNIRKLYRYVKGSGPDRKVEGYELVVMEPDLDNPRRKAVFLSPKGKKLLSEMEIVAAGE